MSEAALRGFGQPRAATLRLASDARLVRIAVRGERRAFAAIFQRYHQELYRYCRAILGDAEEASDALQNTMVKVMRALPGETREIALRPWLYRIAHNEAIAMLRHRRPAAELTEELGPAAPPPEQRVEERERLRHLVEDLESLPDRQRGALVMRELNEIDYSAIGAAFGTSSAVARQTVYEARVALQQMAEGREMCCEEIRRQLSAGDGRVLRARRLRAHLRECEGCRDFREGIRQRRSDLRLLAPAMPAAAAAGLLNSIAGSGGASAGGGAGLAGSVAGGGKVLAGTTVLKAAAAVVATATIAVGAAEVSGVIHPPLISGSSHSATTAAGPAAAPGAATSSPEPSKRNVEASQPSGAANAHGGKGAQTSASSPGHTKPGHTHSKSATAPGHTGATPGATKGNSAFGHSHTPQGQAKANGQVSAPGSNAKPAHSSFPSHPAPPVHPSHPSPGPKAAGSTVAHPAPAPKPRPGNGNSQTP